MAARRSPLLYLSTLHSRAEAATATIATVRQLALCLLVTLFTVAPVYKQGVQQLDIFDCEIISYGPIAWESHRGVTLLVVSNRNAVS